MTDIDKKFAGNIPELYDTLLVPLIFTDYADDLAERVAASNPQSVLETAAGSGVVTRALGARLPDTTRLVLRAVAADPDAHIPFGVGVAVGCGVC